jgi:hypothetical protein
VIKTFVIQPGYDKAGSPLIARKEGQTYRSAWEARSRAAELDDSGLME